MNIFYRISNATLYEQLRTQLDSAWGLEPPSTCVDPANVAPRDSNGHILLAVRPEFVAFDAVAAILPGLLASGAVREITEAEYQAATAFRIP